jgi:hypothetical protein
VSLPAEQLETGLAQVRSVLGESSVQFSDKEIKETIWYYYFDTEKAIDWLLCKCNNNDVS